MTTLFEHQKKGIEFALANNGNCALFWDMGLGKTVTCIEIFKELRKKTPNLKMFVVCPLTLIKAAWGEDVKRFAPELKICNLRVENPLIVAADIYIANYEFMIGARLEALVKGGFFVDKQFMAVIDESSRMKSHNSQTTKVMHRLRQVFKYKIILSGTPAPNIEWEYWPQITFLRENVFHARFHPFKAGYFYLKRGDQVMRGNFVSKQDAREIFSKGWKYFITDQNRQELLARMAPFCSFLKKEDCLDLPEKFDINREYFLTAEQQDVYDQMEEDLVAELNGRFISVNIALSKIIKLRQIGSGFMMDENSTPHNFKENPKMKLLEDTLEEIGEKQVIIWCNFIQESNHLTELLGIKAVTLNGQTRDPDLSIFKFRNNQAQYLIANPASAGHGLTFINCNYQIFYSMDYSWERYAQARDRIYRIGQKNQCTYIHFLGNGTIDHDVLAVLQRKGQANDIVHSFCRKNKITDENYNLSVDNQVIANNPFLWAKDATRNEI